MDPHSIKPSGKLDERPRKHYLNRSGFLIVESQFVVKGPTYSGELVSLGGVGPTACRGLNPNRLHSMKTISEHKTCSACRRSLPLADFGKDRFKADGLNHKCKACRRAWQSDWHTANPDSAAKKSAREAVIREHGRATVTPEGIKAKLEAIRAAKGIAGQRKAARVVPVPLPIPAGTITREALLLACGISYTALHRHRILNALGIGGAVIRGKRFTLHGKPPVLFNAGMAAAFIGHMQSKARFQRNRSVEPHVLPA